MSPSGFPQPRVPWEGDRTKDKAGPAAPQRQDRFSPLRSFRSCRPCLYSALFIKKTGQLLHHRAAEFLGVRDGDGTAVIARHVMADADRHQLDARIILDPMDHF